MVEQGDGSFQKAIDDSRCPKCLAVIDYTRELHIVKLQPHNARRRYKKRKDPRQLNYHYGQWENIMARKKKTKYEKVAKYLSDHHFQHREKWRKPASVASSTSTTFARRVAHQKSF